MNKKNQKSLKNTPVKIKTPDTSRMSKKQNSMDCVSIDLGEVNTRSVKVESDISETSVTLSQCSDKPADEDEKESYVVFLKKGKAKYVKSKSPSGTILAHSKSLTMDWQPRQDFEKKSICPHNKDCCHYTKIRVSGNACQYKSNVSLKDINIKKGLELEDVNLLTSCSSKPKYKTFKSSCSYSKIFMSSSSSGEGTYCFKSTDGNSRDKKIDSKPRKNVNEKSLKLLKFKNLPSISRAKLADEFLVQRRLECEGQNPCIDCLREEKNAKNYTSLQNPSSNSEHLCTECWVREQNHMEYCESQNLKNLCPCGCGFSVDGENETCPCGCGKLAESQPRRDACFTTRTKEIRVLTAECDCELFGNCKLCACSEVFCEISKDNMDRRPSKSFSNHANEHAELRQLETKFRQEIHADDKKQKELHEIRSRCCYLNKSTENNFDEEYSSPTTIKPTFSELMTAVEILRAKCRTKDTIIAVLAEELRGSGCVDKIAKNLTAPCLSTTAWDFDKYALYNYLTDFKIVQCDKSAASNSVNTISKPSNFKVVREVCGCLLLSWKMPEDISRIKGYKIFVNGYFAAHVRSPTRTEALLDPLDISGEFTLKLYAIDIKGNLSDPVNIIYQSSSVGDE